MSLGPGARSLRPLAAAAALLACACPRGETPSGPHVVVESGGRSHVVRVEVADDDAKRQRGLMHRQELPDDRGMIFVFEEEGDHPFWMKDTLIPLDMIFIDARGRVSGVVTRQPLTLEAVSGGPSLYVLEVPGGWAAKRGVKVGDRVRVEGLSRSGRP
ncbi:MAG TPA: DUF192 domain-containing protein [Anaeromyxobacteraceae bacterium]|nr:DUF192 domain-containing protein [Anaeromyxobacteraceae bacterium]